MSNISASTKEPNKKPAKSIRPLATLYPYLLKYKLHVFSALFFLLLAAATTLTLPYAVRNMIDKGFINNNVQFVGNYFTALIAVAVLLAIASSCRYYFVIWLGERVISDVRKDVFKHVSELSISFFDRSQSGEIISRLTADTTQIKSAVGATASMALRNTILSIGALIMMINTSPKLAFIVIGAIPLIILPIVLFGRAVRKRSRDAQDTLAQATAYASESISSIRTVQAFTTGNMVANKFSGAIEDAFEAARKAIGTRSFLTAFAIFLIFSSVIGVLWLGAQSVLAGTMTPGVLTQFLLYALFAAGSMGALSEVWGELSLAAGAAERIAELLNEKSEIQAPKTVKKLPANIKGNMQFSKVHFAYESRPNAPALKGLDLKIKTGETIAVVGASGAGKSTLFSLMLRFYDPQSGTIKIDGIDIKNLDPIELRKQIAIVPQDTVIFAASAAENIAMGKQDASQEDIIQAAKSASAHEFIQDSQAGYETELGERGITLSGGQRQRIAIARAILKNAPILLLDEATSALDAQSEKLVQEALEKLMEGRTTIVIAHRLATILKADRILVMDEGKIVEEGTHKTLSKKKNGIYARLAKLQFDAAN
ncbi:MAG: ABC transporter transmembrane domain-containing protein [Nitratireductor sp.]